MSTRAERGIPIEEAETLAVSVLGFIAEDPATLGRFLVATGLGPQTLRQAATEPGFLASVLEYVLADESLLLTCTERLRIRPTMFAAARHRLAPVGEHG